MTSIVENMIQLAEDENKLFESILSIEFRKAQIIREADLSDQTDSDDGEDVNGAPAQADQDTDDGASNTAANETAKKNIFKKIGEALKKAWEAIVNALKKLVIVIKDFVTKDSKLEGIYGKALANKSNLNGFEGIPNYRPINFQAKPLKDIANEMADLADDVTEKNYFWSEDFVEKCDQVKKDCESVLGEAVPKWDGKDFDFSRAFKELATQQLPADTMKVYKAFAKTTGEKVVQKGLSVAGKEVAGKVTDGNAAGATKKINALSGAAGAFVKTYGAYYKSLRHAIIACGTYAVRASKKQAGAEATPEEQAKTESLVWLAGEHSDSYVDEQFAFI